MDNEKGYVVVTTALLLVVLLGFGALAVDVGLLYSGRSSAQRAADAAALAGAFTFVVSPSAPQPSTAYDQAMSAALVNNVLGTPLTAPEVTVNIDIANERATVEITHTEDTFFARVLGRNSVELKVKAVAETSIDAVATFCAKPWFVPNTVVSELSSCDACQAGEMLVEDGEVTPFAAPQNRDVVLRQALESTKCDAARAILRGSHERFSGRERLSHQYRHLFPRRDYLPADLHAGAWQRDWTDDTGRKRSDR